MVVIILFLCCIGAFVGKHRFGDSCEVEGESEKEEEEGENEEVVVEEVVIEEIVVVEGSQ